MCDTTRSRLTKSLRLEVRILFAGPAPSPLFDCVPLEPALRPQATRAGSTFVQLREFRSLQREVVHQTLLPEETNPTIGSLSLVVSISPPAPNVTKATEPSTPAFHPSLA